ncbi:hypothetical protein [Gordonia terrae]|uniref:hypothetical protein n=1 Tax=Gordonia terrae TaxID=2055 RepID=UPI003F6AB645
MEPVIEYFFGSGDGSLTRWSSPADLTLGSTPGVSDAVLLDFDGDGRRDDAMWDTDADGVADVAALDIDAHTGPDAFYRDSGAGLWDRPVGREDIGPGATPPSPDDPEATDQPGSHALRLDLDDDGDTDAELVGTERAGRIVGASLYVDSDGDGTHDVMLTDLNGDGFADTAYERRDPRFTRRDR